MTRDELAALIANAMFPLRDAARPYAVEPRCSSAQTAFDAKMLASADAILENHAVIALPDEASENVWTNDVTGCVYATVQGGMVVLDGLERLDPDEVRHYAAALLAAARKAEEQS